ncbi:MAG TPA: ion channel [Acetobacteraceae bacterium]|nr:ion channel [Acetobacteraceae bacterium]
MLPAGATGGWSDDWMWGISLIALSVVTHAAGLALIGMSIAKGLGSIIESPWHVHRRFTFFSLVVGVTSVLLAVLHGIEASYWAAAYVWLGAAPDFKRAIYFSLQMVTTVGADAVQLEDRWKLMGPLEAIGGMLMFGLSTAFLFAIMQRVWPFPRV